MYAMDPVRVICVNQRCVVLHGDATEATGAPDNLLKTTGLIVELRD